MKSREQVIKEFVLESTANDYENLETILHEASEWSATLGINVSREEVIAALDIVIREGYAQAYQLSSEPPASAKAVQFSSQNAEGLWFYVTSEGKALVDSLEEG